MPKCTKTAPLSYQHIENKRRIAWLKCLDIKLSAKRYDVMRICGSHFVFGKFLFKHSMSGVKYISF